MARSTLSFFTRLFSTKKKKILEKRGVQGSVSGLSTADEQDRQLEYRNAGRNRNEEMQPGFAGVIGDSEAGKREHRAIVQTEDRPSQIHIADKSPEKFALNYAENIDTAVSVARNTGNKDHDEIGKLKNIDTEGVLKQEKSGSERDNSQNGISTDDTLEYDSMVLLSKLEQLMIKISDSSVQKSIPLVLESLVEMVNNVVEFAEQLPGTEQKKMSLKRLLNRDEQNYKTLNSNYINNERLVVESNSIVNSDNARQQFVDLSNDLLRLINVYLSASVKAFKSNHIGEQWKTLYTGFFVNLPKLIRSSQADH